MSGNLKEPRTAAESQRPGKRMGTPGPAVKPVKPSVMRQLAIKNLLKNAPVSVNDKLITVKAAHHVDKERFQSAFKSLMGNSKNRR